MLVFGQLKMQNFIMTHGLPDQEDYLLQPHDAQILAIFRILCLDKDNFSWFNIFNSSSKTWNWK